MRTLLLLTSLIVAAACAPIRKHDTQLQSLDNFGRAHGATATRNACGPERAPGALSKARAAQITVPANLTTTTLATLSAVPESILKPFFDAGGRLVVSAEAPQRCASLKMSTAERDLASEGRPTLESCWLQERPGAAPVIHLLATTDAVRHGLVRAFAYFYTEFFIDRALKQEAHAPERQAFMRDRDRLVTAFLTDLKRINAATYTRLDRFRRAAPERFAHAALAETIDSYYCSLQSQRIFESVYFETYGAFTKGNRSLATQLGRPVGFKAD